MVVLFTTVRLIFDSIEISGIICIALHVLSYVQLQGARSYSSSELRRSAVRYFRAGGNICLVSYPRERPMHLYDWHHMQRATFLLVHRVWGIWTPVFSLEMWCFIPIEFVRFTLRDIFGIWYSVVFFNTYIDATKNTHNLLLWVTLMSSRSWINT